MDLYWKYPTDFQWHDPMYFSLFAISGVQHFAPNLPPAASSIRTRRQCRKTFFVCVLLVLFSVCVGLIVVRVVVVVVAAVVVVVVVAAVVVVVVVSSSSSSSSSFVLCCFVLSVLLHLCCLAAVPTYIYIYIYTHIYV